MHSRTRPAQASRVKARTRTRVWARARVPDRNISGLRTNVPSWSLRVALVGGNAAVRARMRARALEVHAGADSCALAYARACTCALQRACGCARERGCVPLRSAANWPQRKPFQFADLCDAHQVVLRSCVLVPHLHRSSPHCPACLNTSGIRSLLLLRQHFGRPFRTDGSGGCFRQARSRPRTQPTTCGAVRMGGMHQRRLHRYLERREGKLVVVEEAHLKFIAPLLPVELLLLELVRTRVLQCSRCSRALQSGTPRYSQVRRVPDLARSVSP